MNNKDLGVALVKEACFVCAAIYDGSIVMNTRLSPTQAKKVEELNGQVVGYLPEPCEKCKELMSKGFLLVGIIEEKSDDKSNPYRSGNQWVVTNDYASRLLEKEPDILTRGWSFIDIEIAKTIGLPFEQIKPEEDE